MVESIIVLLEEASVSFCYYPADPPGGGKRRCLSPARLEELIGFAKKQGSSLTFLYGRRRLPARQEEMLASAAGNRIVPLPLEAAIPGAALVLDQEDWEAIPSLSPGAERNLILRLPRESINELASLIRRLLGRFKRLNLCLLDIPKYTDQELEAYRAQLAEVAGFMETEFRKGRAAELNFLTDRMLLPAMSNCEAGLKHLTCAPDGRLYICPGFYYADPEDSVGSLKEGARIKNEQLLRLDHAPICSICDAYHCKRCLYLNKKSTLEINTPSRQQCVLSHLERETSRALMAALGDQPDFQDMAAIPELKYLDPFEELMERKSGGGKRAGRSAGPQQAQPPRAAPATPPKEAAAQLKGAGGYISVRDGERVFRLPALKPAFPQPAAGNSKTSELDTSSIRELLLQVIAAQKGILARLEEIVKKMR